MKKNLLSVTKNNIECAFCKEKNCYLRYYPNHRTSMGVSRISCTKKFEKRERKILGKKNRR